MVGLEHKFGTLSVNSTVDLLIVFKINERTKIAEKLEAQGLWNKI